RLSDVDAAVKDVKKGGTRVLVKSAGGRDLHLVAYGEKNDLKSAANYNSACGGNDPASYARKDGTQRPALFFLGPVHGQEFEGRGRGETGRLLERRRRQPHARRMVRTDGGRDEGVLPPRPRGSAGLHRLAPFPRRRSLDRAHRLCPAQRQGDPEGAGRPRAET